MGLLARPGDDRTIAEKARVVGVSPRTVFNWRHLPGWFEAECLLWQWHTEHIGEQEKQKAKRAWLEAVMA